MIIEFRETVETAAQTILVNAQNAGVENFQDLAGVTNDRIRARELGISEVTGGGRVVP